MNIVHGRRVPVKWLLIISGFALYVAVVSSVTLGPMDISFVDSLKALLPMETSLPTHIEVIIQQVRLPRTLLALSVGAILAMCGTVMQGLFRNPLADPGIIGVSAGASLGAAFAVIIFGSLAAESAMLLKFGTVPVFAFIGGAVTTLLIYRLGSGPTGTSVTVMLLAGVAVAALAGAGIGLMTYFADDQALRDFTMWTMGALSGASWPGLVLAFTTLFILFFCFRRDAAKLNALLLGEAEARHLGINIQSLKRNLIILTAIGVGVTVSLSGMIGFIGLIVPHLGRIFTGPDHRSLLPVSMILGALLLLIADMISRTIAAPMDMPVGIVTAILGAPFFIGLLAKQRGRLR
ncbi:FecCD family ABC transporter permease [Veronia pacifica]|uniref:Iron ABC transporter permease n=1 Tax=Veronia pacifica TaxID=1080227 RepID=A0A1C3EKJ5_9GAMM|nr:iron ABC transporter permease [Veronia pacifica]ODA33744.1 iron ABC transporter permease [Veronia pacifica]